MSKPLSFVIITFSDNLLTFFIQPYNKYVEELHIKLSKPTPGRDEAMDTSSSSLVHITLLYSPLTYNVQFW